MAFRADIEGLRAVAVGAVLVAHASLGFGEGGFVGVDVFFVISGFLITSLLVREIERRGTISLIGFYARRARRLLPAAALVIVVVLIASWFMLTPVDRDTAAKDAIASSLYAVNWRFVAQSADYFGAQTAQSPLQHYWSLAIEEQFYLVWPVILIALAYWWTRLGRKVPRSTIAVVIGVISLASLYHSISYDAGSSGEAYFSTFTRVWELGLGALLALAPASILSRRGAAVVAGLGVAAIVVSALAYSPSTRFPGIAALVPCLGAAAVIGAGRADMPFAPLSVRPMRYVGRISYCLYLWHWPALILIAAKYGQPSALGGSLIVLGSFIPAILTHHLLERPVLESRMLKLRPRRSLLVGAGCTAAGLLATGVVMAAQPNFGDASDEDALGARAVEQGLEIQTSVDVIRPDPLDVDADRGIIEDDGCLVGRTDVTSGECGYGPEDSDTQVVLLGDSHAQQYADALVPIATSRDWHLTALMKVGCAPASTTVFLGAQQAGYDFCDDWREYALERIEAIDGLDMVIVSSASYYKAVVDGVTLDRTDSRSVLREGYAETLERLKATGAKVVMMADIPHAPEDVSDCVSANIGSLDDCWFDLGERRHPDHFDVPAAEDAGDVDVIDVTPFLCPEDICRGVIGNVMVYRGSNHITGSYAESLRPFIASELPDP